MCGPMDTWSENSPTKTGTGQDSLFPSEKQIQHLVFHGAQHPDSVGLLEYSANTRVLLMTLWAAWKMPCSDNEYGIVDVQS